jgi:signal peptidase II
MENPEKNQSQEVKKDEPSSKKENSPKFVWTWKSLFFSFVWMAVLLIVLDQLTKWLVMKNIGTASGTSVDGQGNVSAYGNAVTLIPGFLYIICALNQGSAFSVGASVNWMRYVFIVISWGASGVMVYYWYKHLNKHDNLMNSILMLCLAGAVGNAIDRTFYWNDTTGFSGVIDWIQFYLFKGSNIFYPFPTFNVADSCLTIGVLMAVVTIIVRDIKERKEA